MNYERNRKILFIAISSIFILATIVIIIAAIVTAIINNINSANIKVLVVPSDSQILINGQNYQNGDFAIPPGDYHVIASHENFYTQEQDISIKQGETAKVYIMLLPSDGSDYYSLHPEQAYITQLIAEKINLQKTNQREKDYPIVKILPLNIEYFTENYSEYKKYSISYETDVDNNFLLKITDYTGGNEAEAIEAIKVRGFNPEDYNIKYDDVSSNYGFGKAY